MGNKFYRWLFYVVGLLLLALGITLNTKSNLGMAPVLAGMFCLSQVFNWNFSTLTLIYYIALVAAQFAIRGKNYRLYDLLQVPMSLAFSSFIGVFSALITVDPQALWQKLLVLAAAVIVTGVGITMVVNMRMVPNPGDGIVNAISEVSGMSLGTSKNVFDGGSAAVTIVLSLILTGRIIGVGIGTVINVLCVGRVVAAFSWLCKDKMLRLAFGTGEKTEAAA